MSRKVKNKYFHLGKNIKTDKRLKPMQGVPNTNYDTYNKKTGEFHSRRKFGKDGYAFLDLDVGYIGSHKERDHVHDISRDYRPHEDRDPTKKEKREIKKAKKKRKFW